MKKMKFRYRVSGVAELGKPVAVVIPAGPSGETVSTTLWKIDETHDFDTEVTDEEVLALVKSPYKGYLFGQKAEDLTVEFIRRFPEQAPQRPKLD